MEKQDLAKASKEALINGLLDRNDALNTLAKFIGEEADQNGFLDYWEHVTFAGSIKQDLDMLENLASSVIETWKDETKGNVELYLALEKLAKYFDK